MRRRRKRSLINRYDFAFVFLMSDECGSVPGHSSMKKEIDWWQYYYSRRNARTYLPSEAFHDRMDTASRRPCFFPVVRFEYDANGIYLSSGSRESEPRYAHFIIISKSVLSRLPNSNDTLLVISTKKIYNNSVKLYDYIRWKKNLGSFTVRFYFFYYFLAKHMFYIVETKLYLKN